MSAAEDIDRYPVPDDQLEQAIQELLYPDDYPPVEPEHWS